MIYHFGDEVQGSDREVIRRALDRYPDLEVQVWRPEPDRWTFWFSRHGREGYLCTLRTELDRTLEDYEDDLIGEGLRASRAVDPEPEFTDVDMVKTRSEDLRREGLNQGQVERLLDLGLVHGAEFMKGKMTK